MGNQATKVSLGRPLGYYFDSTPVYEKDLPTIQGKLDSGVYHYCSDINSIPEGYEPWIKLEDSNGERIVSRKIDSIVGNFAASRSALIDKVASTAKVTAATAATIIKVAMPALVESGTNAAKDALERTMPDVAGRANSIIDTIVKELGGNHSGLYNDRSARVGAGEPGYYQGISDSAYVGAAERCAGNVNISGGFDDEDFAEGGCGCRGGFIGADELDTTTVRDYSNSLNSKTKDKIIDEIVDAISKLGFKVQGTTRADKVKSLIEAIPLGSGFKGKESDQRAACTKIARVINQIHGSEIIKETMPADVICQQVVEIISSLSAGMHTEFLAVYNDVRKVLKNLHILKRSLDDDHAAIMQRIKNSDDATLSDEVTTFDDLHKILTDEIERQITLLQNLLNVALVPRERELASLIKDKKEIHGFIEKIDAKVGSTKFGNVIVNVLKGLGITANFALIIERALKTVGITLDEYSKGSNVQALRDHITQNLLEKKMDESTRHEFLSAAELLYRNFYRSKDIAEMLKSQKQGSGENVDYSGGEDVYRKTVMDKRIADRKKLRDLIFKAFYEQLNSLFDRFISSLDILTMKVGSEIPLSDQLDGFRHVLQRVNDSLVRNKNIYYALIGYYNDAMSKSKRDALLSDLKMVSSYIDSILEMSLYKSSGGYFKAVQDHIKAMIAIIDKYSDEIAAKFGRGDDSEFGCTSIEEITGGIDGDLYSEPKIVYKSSKTVHDAIRQFDYNYRVAQIKMNMSHASAEISHYSEKYEKIIANSIADILEDDKKKYDRLRQELVDNDKFGKPEDYFVQDSVRLSSPDEVSNERDAALRFLETQWDVKKKFWATIEAVDTYMRVFTDSLIKNPSDIREIKSMLDEIDVINDWYDDATGNNMVSVFEFFPAAVGGNGVTAADVTYPPESYQNLDREGNHYYDRISTALKDHGAAKALPGNPHLVTMPSLGAHSRAQIKKTFNGLAVLKNLLSVFINVGNKFGGEEISKKVFLTPAQIYNNLIEYLHASAFAQGFDVGEITNSEEKVLPAKFSDFAGLSVEFNTVTGEVTGRSISGTSAAWTSAAYHHGSTIVSPTGVYGEDQSMVHLGIVSASGVDAAALTDNEKKALLFKKRWGVWMRSINSGLKNLEGFGFKMEDDYFVLMLKSIAAKIFTVTGLYDVLDRPMEYNGLSPVRMIIGGADEYPKVDEGAVELYLRLPLLAQFYRNIFGYDAEPEDFDRYDTLRRRDRRIRISMVPDVDGTFAGLIRLIFRKTRFIDNSAYSEDDVKEVIKEVNLIYQRMKSKHPENTVMETIYEFVAEINRRYGIISLEERNQYEREFGYRYDYNASTSTGPVLDRYTEPPQTQYAILPGEGDEEVVRPSAAQRLLGEKFETTEKKRMFTVTKEHRDIVYKFRCMIDRYFESPDEEITFKQAIKGTQNKLKNEAKDAERFKIVSSLVRGIDVYSKVDSMKYVLFHETVVGGLNVLSAMHTLLARFKKRVMLIDLKFLEESTWKYLMRLPAVGSETKNITGLIDFIVAEFKKQGYDDDDDQIAQIVENIMGLNEAKQFNGGHVPDFNDDFHNFAIKGGNGVAVVDSTGNRAVVTRNTNGFKVVKAGNAYNRFFKRCSSDDVLCTLGADASAHPLTGTAAAGSGGLFGVLAGYSVNELKDAYYGKTKSQAKVVAETFMRFLFGREFMMRELIETLFGFGSDFQGLVEVKADNAQLYMSYGGLKTLIEEMFQHVSYFLDLLRPHVSEEIMQRYTDKLAPGSYYWLQEQLLEKIIIGRPQSIAPALPNEPPRSGYVNLDEVMHKLTYTYRGLTREFNHDGSKLSYSVNVSEVNPVGKPSKNSFDKVFADMIFYDSSKPSSGLIRSIDAPKVSDAAGGYASLNGAKVVDFLRDPYEQLHFAGGVGAKMIDTRYAARFYQLYSWKDEFTFNKSLMFSFNQLVAKFIKNFYDTASSKVYSGIVSQFSSGVFNRAISDQLYTYPDTVPLVFIKSTMPIDYKVPSDSAVRIGLTNPDTAKAVDVLSEVVKQYLKFGIDTTMVNDAAARSKLLLRSSSVNSGTVNIRGFAFSRMYANIMLHGIALCIKECFDELNKIVPANARAAAVLRAGILELLYCGRPAVGANFQTAIDLYGGDDNGVPSIQSILRVLLSGTDANKVTRVENVVAYTTGTRDLRADCILAAAALGGAGPVLRKTVEFTKAHDEILNKFGSMTSTTAGTVLDLASNIFPYSDNAIGTRMDELEHRASLFAAIVGRLAESYVAASALPVANRVKSFDGYAEEVRRAANGVMSVYNPAVTLPSRYVVKYDDVVSSITDEAFNNNINVPSGDVTFLMAARAEPVGRALERDSIAGLGVRKPSKDVAPDVDSIQRLTEFGRRMDPDADHILLTSLAVVLKTLIASRNTVNQEPTYLIDNVADVATYMKEKYRANLPAFKLLFKELHARCEFIKRLMTRPEMDITRKFDMVAVGDIGTYRSGIVPSHNPWPYVLKPAVESGNTMDSETAKSRFVGIIDSVARGCSALISTCDQVLREVGDEPKFFEMYQNSIKDYKAQYGFDPLMPITSTLHVLKNTNVDNARDFLPVHSLGDESFKFMYGTRGALYRPELQPLMEHNPGFAHVLEQFNLISDSRMQVDKARAESYMKTFIKLVRYVFESKQIKGVLSNYMLIPDKVMFKTPNNIDVGDTVETMLLVDGMYARDDLVVTDFSRGDASSTRPVDTSNRSSSIHSTGAAPIKLTNKSEVSLVCDSHRELRMGENGDKRDYPVPAYAICKTLPDVIRMTESSMKDDKVKELVEYLCGSHKKKNSLEVQNIVDLNIVPINVHALMREIPLVNLYNYAYTFDRLIVELYYGLKNDNARKLIAELCDYDSEDDKGKLKRITSAKDMLVALLLDPYMDVFSKPGADEDKMQNSGLNYYDSFVKPMMLGVANSGELGRPKFISDQIYNKVVFGEIYDNRDNYNEVGPAAGHIVNVKVDKNERIRTMTLVAGMSIGDMVAVVGGKFNGVVRRAEDTVMFNYLRPIITYVYENPNVHVEQLMKIIMDKVLNPDNTKGIAEFKNELLNGVNDINCKRAALLTALVSKIVVYMSLRVYNFIDRNGYRKHEVEKLIADCAYAMSLLTEIGEIDGDWMGIRPATSANSAMSTLMNAHYSAAPPVNFQIPANGIKYMAIGANWWPAGVLEARRDTYTMGDDTAPVFKNLIEQIVFNIDVTGMFNAGAPTELSPVRRTARQLIISLTTPNRGTDYKRQTTPVKPALLHWLGTGSVKEFNEPGVGIQMPPRGDNENVLDPAQIHSVDVGEIRDILQIVGRLRFDTVFIRNIMFIVNLYRSVRMKMQRDLVYSKDVILRSTPITRSQLTEFFNNQVDGARDDYRQSPRYQMYKF